MEASPEEGRQPYLVLSAAQRTRGSIGSRIIAAWEPQASGTGARDELPKAVGASQSAPLHSRNRRLELAQGANDRGMRDTVGLR
jgi:hypothetical protein